MVFSAAGGRVLNLLRLEVNREFGYLIFQADVAGDYFVYYLPWKW